MSLKADLEAWTNALKAYDAEDFSKALDVFATVTPDSKVYTNVGLIYATIGEHEAAVDNFREATNADNHLAIAYFQCGVSNFLLGRYEDAWRDFDEAFAHLRGNSAIFYEQLGMKFTLYSAEVLFNRGLCAVYNGNMNGGIGDMRSASGAKVTPEHSVIDEAIRDQGDGYTVFSIPVGTLYRPPESKMKNVAKKNYMGEAILVAAENVDAAFTGFHGVTLRERGLDPKGEPIKNFTPPRPRSPPPPEEQKPASAPLPGPRRNGLGDDGPARKPQPPAITTRGPAASRGEPKDARDERESPVSAPARSNTLRTGPGAGGAGPRGGAGGGGGSRRSPPQSAFPAAPARKNSKAPSPVGGRSPDPRVTELYDDYLDGYGTEAQTPAPPTTAPLPPMPPVPKQRQRPPQSARTPSLYSSRTGGTRRSLRRRPSQARLTAANMRTYDDEEGYESGDFDDDMYEFTKIKVKIHYDDDVRGMAISPDLPHESFIERVTDKFGRAYGTLGFKFQDEDGVKVSLKDDTDYEMAIETAREAAKGKPEGKLELWCFDIDR